MCLRSRSHGQDFKVWLRFLQESEGNQTTNQSINWPTDQSLIDWWNSEPTSASISNFCSNSFLEKKPFPNCISKFCGLKLTSSSNLIFFLTDPSSGETDFSRGLSAVARQRTKVLDLPAGPITIISSSTVTDWKVHRSPLIILAFFFALTRPRKSLENCSNSEHPVKTVVKKALSSHSKRNYLTRA